jgi:hypothetical protein
VAREVISKGMNMRNPQQALSPIPMAMEEIYATSINYNYYIMPLTSLNVE